ncbi:MAG: hypothetical protein IJP70_00760 [Bacteroidales bacterium]|nr:hypothetical protein [Bacteroidales bacterium]
MKTNLNHKSTTSKSVRHLGLAAAFLLSLAGLASGCKDTYDLDEKLPSNFGSNLMTYLEKNNFENYSQLVKDLGYEEALSGVSLKTLFAADDDAFERFYANNNWGVHEYDDLTPAQKKMLLYSSMLDNSLQIMNLSSTTGNTGVTEGNCMRRQTSASVYDTVSIISPEEMPDNADAWKYYRENGKSLVCMKDMSAVPMMIFVEKFLTNNKITNEDLNFIFNYKIDRQSGDAHINGIPVKNGNIRSANGFIHEMEEVVTPLENMAEILRKEPKAKLFSRMLDRFSVPYYTGRDVTDAYNLEYGTSVDSVFQWRYLSKRSQGGAFKTLLDNTTFNEDEILKFDPGWNAFYSDDPNALSNTVALQENMGVMLVPSDEALDEYFKKGSGKVLKDYYGEWDNVPNNVIAELINNNMLNSWINSVPSKFDGIVNSNQDRMGIKPSDVDSVMLGCNGAIYLTNKVFSPTSYVSVSFPALIDETMNVMRWAISQLEYRSYLNSLDSYYSLFIPTNNALLSYIDPVSYGETQTQIWRFHYDYQAADESERVWASVWSYDLTTGIVGDSLDKVTNASVLLDRLEDVLDNHIVVGNKETAGIENGHEFYHTKNGGIVRVKKEGDNIFVQGTLQRDQDKWIPVTRIYDESEEGNGKTYILEEQPLLTTNRSVFDILENTPEFSEFYKLLSGSELLESSRNGAAAGSLAGNVASFNNYHYTVYVPTNESLQDSIRAGKLDTWENLENLYNMELLSDSAYDARKAALNAFLRYHIQDNSLMIGLDYSNEGGSDTFERTYETATGYFTDEEKKNYKFHSIDVKVTPTSISVTDGQGHERHVLTDNKALYNQTAREYQLQYNNISSSSFAIVHAIDAPLYFEKKGY